jgi:hypothetical protein
VQQLFNQGLPGGLMTYARSQTSRLFGILLLTGIATSITAGAISDSIIYTPDFHKALADHRLAVFLSVIFQLLTAMGAPAIALSLYGVLKKKNPALSTAFVIARMAEGIFYAISAIAMVMLFGLSNNGTFILMEKTPISDTLLILKESSNFIFGVIFFTAGSLIYYVLFIKSRVIPLWLSLWGIIGSILIGVTAVYMLYSGPSYAIEGTKTLFALPIALQELTMGAWVIVKGFGSETV